MKYIFLLRLYKSSNNIRVISEEHRIEAKNFIYTNVMSILYKFKEDNKDIDCRCIEELLDKCLLAGDLMTWDMDKEYKILKKFISKLSVSEFKIIRRFRMIIEKELIREEQNLKSTPYKLKVFSCFILVLIICEGGILYKTLEYQNKVINIGRQLDELSNLKDKDKEAHFMRYTIPLNNSIKVSKESVRKTNERIINARGKSEGLIYRRYYVEMLNIAFALVNPSIREKIEGCLKEDTFKYGPQYLLLSAKGKNNLRERYIAEPCVAEELYNRKVLLPKDGVVVKNQENDTTIICECDDDIWGRVIFWHSWCDETGFMQSEFALLKDKVTTISSLMPGTEDVFNVYGIADRFKDANIDLINLLPAIDETIGKAEIQIWKSPIRVEDKQEIYAPVYWNYKEKSSLQQLGSENKLYGEKIKLLAPFKRTLPMGQKRSEGASDLARKLCINLNDNETIVSAFERKQKIRINV